MTYHLPGNIATWEVVASIQIFQALPIMPLVIVEHPEHRCLAEAAGLTCVAGDPATAQILPYAEASGQVDRAESAYVDVLAAGQGALAIRPPRFFSNLCVHDSYMVLCTGSPRGETSLDERAWREAVKLMRSYGRPLRIVGARLGGCALREEEFCITAEERLWAVAGAVLVVGTANEWMWAAAGMEKPLVVLYPENVPARRWFHFAGDRMSRVLYDNSELRLMVMVAALRMAISGL